MSNICQIIAIAFYKFLFDEAIFMCYSDIRFVTKYFRQRECQILWKDLFQTFWTFALSRKVLYSLVDLFLECPTRYVHLLLLWYRNAFAYVFDWVFADALFSIISSWFTVALNIYCCRGVRVLFLYF